MKLNSLIYDKVSSSLVLARRLRSCYVMVFFDIDLLLSDLDRLVSDFDRLFLSDIDFLLSSFDWLVLPWTSENVLESWLVRAEIGFSFGFAALFHHNNVNSDNTIRVGELPFAHRLHGSRLLFIRLDVLRTRLISCYSLCLVKNGRLRPMDLLDCLFLWHSNTSSHAVILASAVFVVFHPQFRSGLWLLLRPPQSVSIQITKLVIVSRGEWA